MRPRRMTKRIAIGKAIAAYLETISGPSAFDAFRAALMDGDVTKASIYPAAAKRGLSCSLAMGVATSVTLARA